MTRPLVHTVEDITAQLVSLKAALYTGVLQRIDDARGGLRAARFDAISTGGGISDPTASLALRESDVAGRHADELAAAIDTARTCLAGALAIAELYPAPRMADASDRAALARINGRDPCCENCATLVLPSGERRWEPIDADMTEATTVGGVLDEPILLCQWCRKRTSAWGRLPTFDELVRHHRGERVPWPADVARPA